MPNPPMFLVVRSVVTPAVATVTYNLATESNAGMDGAIQWQSVFLLNDGRIASFGTGNHAPEQSNAMRIIDPVASPPSVSTYDEFPHTQSGGANLYVSNYDNHPSIYIPGDNVAVWPPHGVFDFAVGSWTYGDRSPNTETWDDYVDATARPSFGDAYNPAVAWCAARNKGLWFGNSAGGTGNEFNTLLTLDNTGPGAWKINAHSVTGLSTYLGYSRNSAVCVGDYLYLFGPLTNSSGVATGGNAFYKINVVTYALTATLTAPADEDDYFPQMVYDSSRQKIILIGKALQEYDLSADTWTDISPAGWPGFTSPMGVYHPTLNAIFFRGIRVGGVDSDHFKWHRISWG
jgi:hypothetical protein